MIKLINMVRVISVAVMLSLVSANSFAFKYPIGIPNAWIEPDIPKPERPVDWSVDVADHYFISTNGGDCDADRDITILGNETLPRCAIPATIPAGSYVEIKGLDYFTSKLYLLSLGTETKPVWLVSDDQDFVMSMVISGSYLYMDGFNFRKNNNISIRPYSGQTNNIMVRNSSFIGDGTLAGKTALNIEGESDAVTHDIITYNNELHYNGVWDYPSENDRHAQNTGSYLHNIWMLYNNSSYNGGDGVQLSHGGVDAHNIYIGGNTSHHERENCIDIKTASDIVVSENICSNIVTSSSSPGEAFTIHYNTENVWMINNQISEAEYGIALSNNANNMFIIGNTITDMHEWAGEYHSSTSAYNAATAIQVRGASNVHVENNTFSRVNRVLAYLPLTLPSGNLWVRNNVATNMVYSDFNKFPPITHVSFSDNSSQKPSELGVVFENNLFEDFEVYFSGKPFGSLKAFKEAGYCTGCIEEDALLDDNLVPLIGSPVIDAGTESTLPDLFKQMFNTDLDIGADLNSYARTPVADMGYFETNGVYVPVAPTPPSSFYVDVVNSKLKWVNKTPFLTDTRIYKNGTLFNDTIDPNANELVVSGITDSIDNYKLEIVNPQGLASSDTIKTDLINVTEFTTSLNVVVDSDVSLYLPRQNHKVKKGMVINDLTYLGQNFGTNYSKVSFSSGGEAYYGYSYILGEKGNEVKGSVANAGIVDIYTVNNNYSGLTTTSELIINDSRVITSNTGGFLQHKVNVDSASAFSFVYKPVSTDGYGNITTFTEKSALGISAIIEK